MTVLTEAEGTCKTCGLWVYTFWYDATPPNGACPDRKDGAAAACPTVLASLFNARSGREVCRQIGQEPSPRAKYLEALQKSLGITDADLDAYHARTEDEDDEMDGEPA
jgi:hypothetical protein